MILIFLQIYTSKSLTINFVEHLKWYYQKFKCWVIKISHITNSITAQKSCFPFWGKVAAKLLLLPMRRKQEGNLCGLLSYNLLSYISYVNICPAECVLRAVSKFFLYVEPEIVKENLPVNSYFPKQFMKVFSQCVGISETGLEGYISHLTLRAWQSRQLKSDTFFPFFFNVGNWEW